MSKIRHKSHNRKENNHIIGKMLAMIEFITSVIFYTLLWNLGVVPNTTLIIIGVAILFLFGICTGLQYTKKNTYLVGCVLSICFSILFMFASYYIRQMDTAMGKVGGATYKTDNMVVVVRKEDKAETIYDAKDYQFGFQSQLDKENTKLMINKVNHYLEEEIQLTEYQSLEELAQALLSGKVDAAIYNEAFNGMLGDTIEDYESKIRVLYQYGIDTQLEVKETTVQEPFHVYISGIDVYGPITTNSRSDVNIIMTVNPDTKQILLTTTPRDYYVPIPGVSGGQKDKLTHAGIYGVDKSMKTLEAVYGIDISYYARVNFTSLVKIVDILGGIDVYSEYAFTSTHGKYKFQEGMNHMNGEQALGFSRERYSFQAGDNQRGKNQEAVVSAILKKVLSPAVLKNANSLIDSVSDSVETNMRKDEMTDLIRMQLEDGSSWDIQSVNAVGSGDKQACYSSGSQLLYVMHPNMESVTEISAKMNEIMDARANRY